jgi:hypothetical protein
MKAPYLSSVSLWELIGAASLGFRGAGAGEVAMTVVFDVHEEVAMKYVVQESLDGEKIELANDAMRKVNYDIDKKKQPHINKLYEDIFERIETSSKHPITYDIISFEKLREE